MSDIAKWALLVAGMIAIIALIVALPIFDIINVEELTNTVSSIATICSNALRAARGLINYFLTPVGRNILTVVIGYEFGKFAYKWGIKILAYAYKWIFK